jgi:hypothetical protein
VRSVVVVVSDVIAIVIAIVDVDVDVVGDVLGDERLRTRRRRWSDRLSTCSTHRVTEPRHHVLERPRARTTA